MVLEATRKPTERGVGGRPKYQSGEERTAIKNLLASCIDTNDMRISTLPAETNLADREVYLQRDRELKEVKQKISMIDARRRANQDRINDHNSVYAGSHATNPGLQSRPGLSAYYGPYADNESTEYPRPPTYCFEGSDKVDEASN